MAFAQTWDEATPPGTADANTLDTIIQGLKTSMRERFQRGGGYWPSAHDEDAGEHAYATLREQAAKPTAEANKGYVYTKDVSGVTELFFEDSAGNEIQLTTGGALKETVNAKTGDFLPSGVTTARAGWTNVSATYTDRFMRVNATPLTTGGTDTHAHGAGSYAGPAHTHTVSTSTEADAGSGGSPVYPGGTGGDVHTHSATTSSSGSGSVTGTSASSNNIPAFFQVVLFQKS